MKYQLNIRSNTAYSAKDADGVTVGELLDLLSTLKESDEIVLNDLNNQRGACIGTISLEVDKPDESESE